MVVTAAVVGAGVSAYSAYSNQQNAKKARSQQQAMYDQERMTAEEERNYYRKRYAPLEDKLLGYATSEGYTPQYGLALGTLSNKFAGLKRDALAQNAAYGYSGLNRGQQLGLGIEQAKATAGLGLQDQANKTQVGLSLLNHDRSFDAARGAMGVYGQQGDRYGNQAAGYSGAAQAGWGSLASGIGGLATYLGTRDNGSDTVKPPTDLTTPGAREWGGGIDPSMLYPGQPQPYGYQPPQSYDSALAGAPDPYGIPQ
jgi:hypothetical protein